MITGDLNCHQHDPGKKQLCCQQDIEEKIFTT